MALEHATCAWLAAEVRVPCSKLGHMPTKQASFGREGLWLSGGALLWMEKLTSFGCLQFQQEWEAISQGSPTVVPRAAMATTYSFPGNCQMIWVGQ